MIKKEEILLEKAQNGDAQAMLDLGRYYYFPLNDYEKALFWYEKALEMGCYDAYMDIAYLYEQLDIQRAYRFNPNSESINYNLSIETIYGFGYRLL